jgi:type I restriction enzyme S subunit
VDQAIEKVDQAIEKTQRLKKGLMQELLTRGIGHKDFKETQIGRIPKEWEVTKLGEAVQLERGKFAFRPRNDPRFYGGKFPFIQTGDITQVGGIIKKYSQTLNEEGFKISKLFKKGTIVISIAGNIGDVGILDFDSCFPDSIVGINVNSGRVNNLFLMYLLHKLKGELNSVAPRSTQKNINLQILETFKLPIPPLIEQQKIAEILSTVDERLKLLTDRKEKLETTKKGLMNDLLTGTKRVRLEV